MFNCDFALKTNFAVSLFGRVVVIEVSGLEKMYTVKRQAISGVQVGCSTADLKDQGIQCSFAKGSYKRDDKEKNFTSYDDLLLRYLWDRDYTLSWLKAEGLIASSRTCGICGSDMI